MRIRWKLLLLLLAIALGPLLSVTWFHQRSMWQLGEETASSIGEAFSHSATHQLLRIVQDYGVILQREREVIERALKVQALEVERLLAAEPTATPSVFYAEDYDRGDNLPQGMALSSKHYRVRRDGEREPIAVTYADQVFRLAPGVTREAVADDVIHLAPMVSSYQSLHDDHPDLIYWQYTSLESGVHSSYPGHGGYPGTYDPRERVWYREARQRRELVWSPPITDASTGRAVLTASMPVRRSDASFAGVTAIDVLLAVILDSIDLPDEWRSARTLLVALESKQDPQQSGADVVIVAEEEYQNRRRRWDAPIELETLHSSDTAQFGEMVGDMLSRRSGVRRMRFRGRDSLWAYGRSHDAGVYLVVIVPYDEIVAEAVGTGTEVLRRTGRELRITAFVLGAVILLVALVAFLGSRAVTRPVRELAAMAQRVAQGDFEARTRIRTRDELGELGGAFNAMVPHLEDRLRIRESLALATEVQQHLLPTSAPQIEGLDIAGRSIYCDGTGGDYYDFVELPGSGSHRIGVAVGDVTGHGVAAALLMSTGRALLRSHAIHPGSLSQMMTDVNGHMTASIPTGQFMTLLYMVIDGRERTIRWVSAGHHPAITYVPSTDTFGELAGHDVPLGVDPAWEYRESPEGRLQDGQIIVVGTDGIWEARNARGEMFGKECLRDVIRRHAHRAADEIGHAITDSVAAFRQTHPQEDDVAMVVVKVRPQTSDDKG